MIIEYWMAYSCDLIVEMHGCGTELFRTLIEVFQAFEGCFEI